MVATFVVEDGTGLAAANAYVSEADADQYDEDYADGTTTWSAAAQADKELAIRMATQYLDAKFKLRWVGGKKNGTQALDWPRSGAKDESGFSIDDDSLPTALVQATVELARDSVGGTDLFVDETAPVGGVDRELIQVDVIKLDTTYTGGASAQRRFTIVENLLRDLVTSGDIVIRA